MSCSVIGGMLSLTQSINQSITSPTVGGGAIMFCSNKMQLKFDVIEIIVYNRKKGSRRHAST